MRQSRSAISCAAICATLLLSSCAEQVPADNWRDLNRNGKVDAYENPDLSVGERVADLISRMTLEEKAGTVLHATLPAVDSPIGVSAKGYDLASVKALVREKAINSFVTGLIMPATEFAAMNNAVQEIAAQSRLGIPITISSDPRNHFFNLIGASNKASGFSMWPEPLGLAALGDTEIVRTFADVARQEYRAVGIHVALSPQADLGTEPRWPRISATFGADADKVSAFVAAYVRGMQGAEASVAPDGVAVVVKHWVGYGAAPSGFDAHNYYGRKAAVDQSSIEAHIRAFDGAFAANVSGVMPSYAMIEGVTIGDKPVEPVGGSFSDVLLSDVLRRQKGFNGFVLSDWAILNDCPASCSAPTADDPQTPVSIGIPWGAEALSKGERAAKAMAAGVDQFGGVDDPEPIIEAVKSGAIPVDRLNEAVARVLRLKFHLGLFENPFVDTAQAGEVLGARAFREIGEEVQRGAQVLLENNEGFLPLTPARGKVWLSGIEKTAAQNLGFETVDDLASAELAIVRIETPSEMLHPHHFFGRLQKEGRLAFLESDEAYRLVLRAAASVPTIVAVDMDRPAVLTNIRDQATALIALFGASDAALLDVIVGNASPKGKLAINLPSSMSAVESQHSALPDDDENPLYPVGYGLTYDAAP